MLVKAQGYNQNGEAIAVVDGKVFYIPGLINGEEAKINILEEHEKWGKAKIEEIVTRSKHRNDDLPKDWEIIGGYELLHMAREEQTNFKVNKIISDFKMNAKTDINLEEMFIGKKQLRYRNKITLHDGAFYAKKTNTNIHLDDFLLTDIKPYTSKPGDIIIRKLDTIISGKKTDKIYTTDTMMGFTFRVSLGAFYQSNKEVAEVAYRELLKFIDNKQIVFDLFSGIGSITLHAAKVAKYVIGVEWTKSSFNDAEHNAKFNNVRNVEFRNQDVKKFLKTTSSKPHTIIVDPGRDGLKRDICESILKIKPKRIIYLSCNPATQAADYNRFKLEYKIIYAKPFDMFPQTTHIENLIVLDRIKD